MSSSNTILYCHGFNSSAHAYKAQRFRAALANNNAYQIQVPNLAYDPAQALTQLHQLMQIHTPALLVGSSLGGFYATVLAEQYNCPAVLLNPSVTPAQTLQRAVHQVHYSAAHNCEYTFLPHYLETLAQHTPEQINPDRYYVLLTSGDEVLDYRAAQARYAGSQGMVIYGNSHQIEHFDDFLPPILRFIAQRCGLA